MEIVAVSGLFAMAFICLSILVYLKQKTDREMLKDVLGLRVQMDAMAKIVHHGMGSNNAVTNKFLSAFQETNRLLIKVADNADSANIATQTILREYELNGTPLGYIRKEEEAEQQPFGMFEGV